MARIFVLAALACALALALSAGAPPASAQQDYRLELDGNLQNGVCDPVDSAITVPPGQRFQVAICVFNPEEPPDAFQLHVRYDRERLSAPEVEDEPPALDDNPDANAGAITYGSTILGSRWDCTAFGVLFPTADWLQTDIADAIIVCNANIATPDTQLTRAGAMAAITFVAEREGQTEITFEPDNQIAGASRTVYTCGENPSQTIPCRGLSVTISAGAPTLPPTTMPTPRGTEAPLGPEAATATAAALETAMAGGPTPTPSPADGDSDGDGGLGAGAIAGIIVGVVVVAAALGAGGYLLYRRRRSGSAGG
jgi:hypothetical protein